MLGRVRGFFGSLPEEVWFFLRIAAYAVFIGTVYWFLTYEDAGTMLLYGFGIAAGFGTIVLGLAARSRRKARESAPEASEGLLAPDGPFGDERGRIPGASVAPIVMAIAVAFGALGAVFGAWLIIAGVAIGLVAAVDWARSASAEYGAVATESPAEAAASEPPSVPPSVETARLGGPAEREASRPASTG